MSTQRIDYKQIIEEITGLKVYPIVIPQNAVYPCIELSISGGARDNDSSMDVTNIKGYRISLTICSSLSSINDGYESLLINALDNKPNVKNGTRTLVMYHIGTVQLYNYTQGLHEMTVDFTTKTIN
jgi:hypothetical protein